MSDFESINTIIGNLKISYENEINIRDQLIDAQKKLTEEYKKRWESAEKVIESQGKLIKLLNYYRKFHIDNKPKSFLSTFLSILKK